MASSSSRPPRPSGDPWMSKARRARVVGEAWYSTRPDGTPRGVCGSTSITTSNWARLAHGDGRLQEARGRLLVLGPDEGFPLAEARMVGDPVGVGLDTLLGVHRLLVR